MPFHTFSEIDHTSTSNVLLVSPNYQQRTFQVIVVFMEGVYQKQFFDNMRDPEYIKGYMMEFISK